MRENERIYLDATLLSMIESGVFRAELENGHEFVAYSQGDKRGACAAESKGRRVTVRMSPYDMSKGLIVDQPEKRGD